MIDRYGWRCGSEAMLRFGPADGPVVIAAMPPFEEANRTRAFIVAVLRMLADRGIGCALPDVPGAGESLVPTEHAVLAHWREAFAAAAASLGSPVFSLAIRGGALLDADAALAGRWHFAPVSGATLLREMIRTRQAAAREEGGPFDPASMEGAGPPVELAGNPLSREFIAELRAAEPARADRVLRLEGDAQPADRKIPGAPLWRRAEPGQDLALAALLADDIVQWVHRCVA